MVTKSTVNVKILVGWDTNFKFILSSVISNYFPVVDSSGKTYVGDCTSENIWLLLQEDLWIIFLGGNSCSQLKWIPANWVQIYNFNWTWWSINLYFLEKTFNNLVHFFSISEIWIQLVECLANLGATWLDAFNSFVLDLFTVFKVPTFDF